MITGSLRGHTCFLCPSPQWFSASPPQSIISLKTLFLTVIQIGSPSRSRPSASGLELGLENQRPWSKTMRTVHGDNATMIPDPDQTAELWDVNANTRLSNGMKTNFQKDTQGVFTKRIVRISLLRCIVGTHWRLNYTAVSGMTTNSVPKRCTL